MENDDWWMIMIKFYKSSCICKKLTTWSSCQSSWKEQILAFSSDLMQKLTSAFPFENCFGLSRQGGRQIVNWLRAEPLGSGCGYPVTRHDLWSNLGEVFPPSPQATGTGTGNLPNREVVVVRGKKRKAVPLRFGGSPGSHTNLCLTRKGALTVWHTCDWIDILMSTLHPHPLRH